MATHSAVAITAVRQPLSLVQVPTLVPGERELKIKVEWANASPLALHQADGGLMVKPPQIIGSSAGGVVVEVGPGVKYFKVGDRVAAYTGAASKEKAWQQYIVSKETAFTKCEPHVPTEAAINLADSFVTAFWLLEHLLSIPLPYPKPADYVPASPDSPILVWGGSGAAGQVIIQVLKHYGYRNIIATASKRNHALLESLGATKIFDHSDAQVGTSILEAAKPEGLSKVIDAIGSKPGSLEPISKIVGRGAEVAVLMPVMIEHATEDKPPVLGMEVESVVPWAEGVKAIPVFAMQYVTDPFLLENVFTTMMPTLTAQGAIRPVAPKVVEGATFLERAQKALDMLRRQEVSGQRLVFRVPDEE